MRRKIFLSLLLVSLLFGGYVFAQSGTSTGPSQGELISMPYQNTPPKRFRVVRYLGPQDLEGLAADAIVVWDTTEDDGITIIETTTSSDSTVAGIIENACLTQDTDGNTAAQDRGKDNWTWLQTYGKAQVDVITIVGAGDAMGTGTTAGEASNYAPTGNNAKTRGNAGFFMDAAAKDATDVEVFLKCE